MNAPAVTELDDNSDGTRDRRLYATWDANFNVTALVADHGRAVERYVWAPYGNDPEAHNGAAAYAGATLVLNGSESYTGSADESYDWSVDGTGSDYGDFHIGFQGMRWDPDSKTFITDTRRYLPSQGTFGGRDPQGTRAYATQGMNLDQAFLDNPVDVIDPTGLQGGAGNGVRPPAVPQVFIPYSREVKGKDGKRCYIWGVFTTTYTRKPGPNPNGGHSGGPPMVGNTHAVTQHEDCFCPDDTAGINDLQRRVQAEARLMNLAAKDKVDTATTLGNIDDQKVAMGVAAGAVAGATAGVVLAAEAAAGALDSEVVAAGDAIEGWLGDGATIEESPTSDLYIKSKDGERQIRFDLENSHGDDPHINVESFEPKDRFPGDVRMDPVDNLHIYPPK